MDKDIAQSELKPRWVKPLSVFYCIALIPSVLFLLFGFSLGGNDPKFGLFILLGLLMCASLFFAIKIGFKKENNTDFSSGSRKLMIAPIYLIGINALAPMLADISSSVLRGIFGGRDTEDVIYYFILIGCLIHYYYFYKREE